MKKRIFALLLALALTLSAGAVYALEGGDFQISKEAAAAGIAPMTLDDVDTAAPETETPTEEPEAEAPAEETEPPTLAGPDAADIALPEPDAVGYISFANLENRVRSNNLTLLSLEEQIKRINATDYDKMKEDLRESLNSIAKAQLSMLTMDSNLTNGLIYSGVDPIVAGAIGMSVSVTNSSTLTSLQATYDSLKETFNDLKSGKIQETAADGVRQLRAAQDQIVMGAESLYVALVSLETQNGALQRQLASLNRTVEEMELRYQLGQISALQLQQVKAGRTALISGMGTLQMNIRNLKLQLESMIGAELTGEIKLGALPAATSAELAKMDESADLTASKAASFTIRSADKALTDAKKDYDDIAKEHNYYEGNYDVKMAKYTWEAAQYTHRSSIQSYELNFSTLYNQVKDYAQILNAQKVSLESQKASFEASELRYQQGTISKNAYLTAKDDLAAAQEAVQTASENLFSAYNNYCWAVQHGILN